MGLTQLVPWFMIPAAGVAMWVLGILLLVKLETDVGWRRRAWRFLDRCPVCGYSYAGLVAEAPCPECGHGRNEPSPIKVPVRWLWTMGLVAVFAPVVLYVAGVGGWSKSHSPLFEVCWAWLLGSPTLLMASWILACLWPCGPRMRWSMATCLLAPGVVALAILMNAGAHRDTGGDVMPFAFAAAVGLGFVPPLLLVGISVGYVLNRQIEPVRPGLS